LFTAFFFFKKESRGTKKFWGQKFFYLFKSIETATSVEFPSFVPHVICKLILDYTVFGLHTRVGQDGPVINRKWGPEGIVYQVFFFYMATSQNYFKQKCVNSIHFEKDQPGRDIWVDDLNT